MLNNQSCGAITLLTTNKQVLLNVDFVYDMLYVTIGQFPRGLVWLLRKMHCQFLWVLGLERRFNWGHRQARLAAPGLLRGFWRIASCTEGHPEIRYVSSNLGSVQVPHNPFSLPHKPLWRTHCKPSTCSAWWGYARHRPAPWPQGISEPLPTLLFCCCHSRAYCPDFLFLLSGTTITVLTRSTLVTSATGILPLISTVHSLNWIASASFLISFCSDFIFSTCSLSLRLVFASAFILASL